MRKKGKRGFFMGGALLLAFVLWTVLVLCVDVQPVGQNGTNIGLAGINTWFHELTGENLTIYNLTDLLSVIPFAVCLGFAVFGVVQLIQRKSLRRVDPDILLLGGYYVVVILFYLVFDRIPINYRPIPIDGVMEISYPSSTTLLVLSVMPTLQYQIDRRVWSRPLAKIAAVIIVLFTAFMVIGRLISGVHWLTDIIGGVLLSLGLFRLYRTAVSYVYHRG